MIGSSGLKILPVDNLDEAARSEGEIERMRKRDIENKEKYVDSEIKIYPIGNLD